MTCKSMACSACSFHTFKLHVVLSVVCEIKWCQTWAEKRWVGVHRSVYLWRIKTYHYSFLWKIPNLRAEMFIALNFYMQFTHLHKSNIVCTHTFASYKSICFDECLRCEQKARQINSHARKGVSSQGKKKKKIRLLPFHMRQVDLRNRCEELRFVPACIERPR